MKVIEVSVKLVLSSKLGPNYEGPLKYGQKTSEFLAGNFSKIVIWSVWQKNGEKQKVMEEKIRSNEKSLIALENR